jgi:hypothetical protein
MEPTSDAGNCGMKRRTHWIDFLILGLIVGFAGTLRFMNLEFNPGIYSDEGTILEIARNVQQGNWSYFAFNQGTLLVARLPLFPLIVSRIMGVLDNDLLALRSLTAVLGVLAVLMIYFVVRRIVQDRGLALLASLVMAIYPSAVVYSRLGFSYNLLAPLALLLTLFLWEYLHGSSHWLALAALVLGMGTISDIGFNIFALPFIFIILYKNWKDLFWSLPIFLTPLLIYGLVMNSMFPQAFLFDLQFTLSRLGGIPLIAQIPTSFYNFGRLLYWDPWIIIAAAGCFIFTESKHRWFFLIFLFLPIISLGRTVTGLAGLGFYYLIPTFPFVAIGAASFLKNAGKIILRYSGEGFEQLLLRFFPRLDPSNPTWLKRRSKVLFNSLIIFSILIGPLLINTMVLFAEAYSQFNLPIDEVLVNASDAFETIELLNQQTDLEDVVLASPAIAWAVEANAADFQQAIAAKGLSTIHLPADIPRDRFNFDPTFENTSFVVVDPIWRNWAAEAIPEVGEMLNEVEKWPVFSTVGEVLIFKNPTSKSED